MKLHNCDTIFKLENLIIQSVCAMSDAVVGNFIVQNRLLWLHDGQQQCSTSLAVQTVHSKKHPSKFILESNSNGSLCVTAGATQERWACSKDNNKILTYEYLKQNIRLEGMFHLRFTVGTLHNPTLKDNWNVE